MTVRTIPVVWSPETRRHEPEHEVWVGVPTPGTEVPERVDAILDGAGRGTDADRGDAARRRACSSRSTTASCSTFLAGRRRGVGRGPYDELVGQDRVVPYFFPTPAMTRGHAADAGRPRLHAPGRAVLLRHDDAGRPGHLGGGPRGRRRRPHARSTWSSPGERTAYALCRPPGHHATRDGYGGSCYLNNAAVAAEALRDAGHDRVAVVDLDAHHGNGTQAVFWERGRTSSTARCTSTPAPAGSRTSFGHADETGGGAGPGRPATSRCAEGTGDGGVARGRAATSPRGWRRPGARRWSSRSGSTPPADDPESPLQVTADGYPAAGRAARRPRPAGGAGAGGRLPPRHDRRAGVGLPGRSRRRLRAPPAGPEMKKRPRGAGAFPVSEGGLEPPRPNTGTSTSS